MLHKQNFEFKGPNLMPYKGLIHICHAAPLPFSNNDVSFVKIRMVAVHIRSASPTV
jgi:hypothetical protein